ncbi:MAG: sigma-54 dependent transcriptional regulator, partial [Verrucomicrobiota bacterium]
EDEPVAGRATKRLLEHEGYTVEWAKNGREGLQLAANVEKLDAVLTDFRMPEVGGMELLEKLRESNPHLPVILMTAHGSASLAIEATRKGAYDYILKPYQPSELFEVVERAVEASRQTQKRVQFGQLAAKETDTDFIIGNSRAMQQVYKDMGRIADKADAVLIRGEAGTGKNLVARAIWQHSDRAEKPFISVNCATISENLLESELFGHEKGAFPGAITRRIGRIEQADGGTLFLDELGEIEPQIQAKLVQLLQEESITRIGGFEKIPASVRVIVATSSDLEHAIQQHELNEDFSLRLNAAHIYVPPLREREDDVRLLTEYHLKHYAASLEVMVPEIEPTALERLLEYSWPGNVTELESVIRRALLQNQGFSITRELVDELLDEVPVSATQNELQIEHRMRELLQKAETGEETRVFSILQEEFERAAYSEAINFAGGNQSKLARWLGVSRVTLRDKLDKYHLFPNKSEAKRS